jgi:hypothetical protein
MSLKQRKTFFICNTLIKTNSIQLYNPPYHLPKAKYFRCLKRDNPFKNEGYDLGYLSILQMERYKNTTSDEFLNDRELLLKFMGLEK